MEQGALTRRALLENLALGPEDAVMQTIAEYRRYRYGILQSIGQS